MIRFAFVSAALIALFALPSAVRAQTVDVLSNDSINGVRYGIINPSLPNYTSVYATGAEGPRLVNVNASAAPGTLRVSTFAQYTEALPYGSNLSCVANGQASYTDSFLVTSASGSPVSLTLGVALTGYYELSGAKAGYTQANSSLSAYLVNNVFLGGAGESENQQGRTGKDRVTFTVSSGSRVYVYGALQVSAFAQGLTAATANYGNTAKYFVLTDTPGATVSSQSGYDYIAAGQVIASAPEAGAGWLALVGLPALGLVVRRRASKA